MEATGIRINKDYIDKVIPEIEQKVKRLNQEVIEDKLYKVWQKEYGSKTNLGSSDQLRHMLFNKMGYKSTEVTAKGKEKTSRAVLDVFNIPLLQKRDEIQKLNKVLSTYIMGIKREMVKHDDGFWYVHPVHNLHTTSTYRPSSEMPNVRNVPKRDEEMAKFVRRCYLPLPGHHLVSIDFSTLEVKIAYCLHKDPVMKKYLEEGGDMHEDAAIDLFMLPRKLVERKTTRDCAKNRYVFASFYGSIWATPAPDKMGTAQFTWQWIQQKNPVLPNGVKLIDHLANKGITELGPVDGKIDPPQNTWAYHVKQVDKKLWERFKVYDQWRKQAYEDYKKKGYMEYVTGFVVHTHHKRNDVINYVVQGPAYHVNLKSCILIDRWIQRHKLKSRLINEIYDCIVASVHPNELQDYINYATTIMSKKVPELWPWIITPLKTEVDVTGVDEDWSKEKEWVKNNDRFELWQQKN